MGRQHWVYWSSNKRLNSLFGTKANKRFFLVRHEILRWDFEMMRKPTRGIIPCSAYLLRFEMKANKRFLPCSAHTHWDEILRPPTRGFFLVRWGFWWFFLPRRRWWWYRVTRNKSAKWFRYDILVCYRSRLENDDHVMTMIWEYGWEVTIKSMIVDLRQISQSWWQTERVTYALVLCTKKCSGTTEWWLHVISDDYG